MTKPIDCQSRILLKPAVLVSGKMEPYRAANLRTINGQRSDKLFQVSGNILAQIYGQNATETVGAYNEVIPYMSEITLHLGLSIFWIRAYPEESSLWRKLARIHNIEGPRCRVIPDM